MMRWKREEKRGEREVAARLNIKTKKKFVREANRSCINCEKLTIIYKS